MRYPLACYAILGLLSALSGAAADRPNVLFIAVDDLRVELGCYGNKRVKSPHIDALAARGTVFTRAYCQQAVCNPSRASLLTGLRPDTIRVWDLPTHFRKNRPDAVTLPQLFKQNGYHSQGIGKIFHNWRQDDYKGDPASWSVPATLHYASHYTDHPLVDGEPPRDWSTLQKTECRDVPDKAYFDGRVADRAVQALRELKDKSFFLAVGFWKPHLPFNAPKRYWDLYDRDQIDLPLNPDPPTGVPQLALQDYQVDRKKNLTDDDVRELRHGYYAATSYLDAQVGKLHRVARLSDRCGRGSRTLRSRAGFPRDDQPGRPSGPPGRDQGTRRETGKVGEPRRTAGGTVKTWFMQFPTGISR
jgi:iduronate 2-sulfatase